MLGLGAEVAVETVDETGNLGAKWDVYPRPAGVDALRDQPLISLPHGTGLRAALDIGCANVGFEPRIAFEASVLPMVAQLAGIRVAILPASTADHSSLRCTCSRSADRSYVFRLEIVWDPAMATNPAARVLIEHTRTFMRRLAANRAPAA